jgi:hypothetical protein
MGQNVDLSVHRLRTRAVGYKYRYCPSCRRELPSRHKSCPYCVRWLGDEPLARTEWQLVPESNVLSPPRSYELIGASALLLRLVCGHSPDSKQMAQLTQVIGSCGSAAGEMLCEVPGVGWLAWTAEGLRSAFRQGREIEQRVISLQPLLKEILLHVGDIRWGIWIDQYIVPFDGKGAPVISDAIAQTIFDLEPDNMLLASETVYRTNRRWENFVCVPRRLLNGEESSGFLLMSHKRPSALDHAQLSGSTPFVGRDRELLTIEESYRHVAARTTRLAIVAPAGSGKTRLIAEWRRQHPDVHSPTANFSLFGGNIESFASQLAELPPERLDEAALIEAVVGRVRHENVKTLVLDDLHWAGPSGINFLRQLIAALSPSNVLVVLAARPSGRHVIDALAPTIQLTLEPLPAPAVKELARRLTSSAAVASAAALRSHGNPLFIEQFVAWAVEANFTGGENGPRSLHQIIAARIQHLLNNRVETIRQRWRWGGSWQRQLVQEELEQIEREIGLWLDRLETGDYAERAEAACHLNQLERLEYEIFILSVTAGRARPRSSRLREAIERLVIGSASEILADLKRRAAEATGADKENIAREARRAADILFDAHDWHFARDFYQLAHLDTLWERNEIARRLSQCGLHCQTIIMDDSEVYSAPPRQNLDERPSVDALDLPYVWAELGAGPSLRRILFTCQRSR